MECEKFKREKSRKSGEEKQNEKNTTVVISDIDINIICDDDSVDHTYFDCTWIIDLGISFYVTPRYDFFITYISDDFSTVKMENGVNSITGMEDVCLEISNGCQLLLKNLRHVPNIYLT